MVDEFNYKIITFNEKTAFKLEEKLNNLGQSGWEIIHISKFKLGIVSDTFIIEGLMKQKKIIIK